jgi:hypothetical protein
MSQQQQPPAMSVYAVMDWLFKIVQAVICFFAFNIYNDVQDIKTKLPVHEVRIEFLEKKVDKLQYSAVMMPFKHEDLITLDSLKNR